MCGAKNSDIMLPRTTLMEGMNLTCDIIDKLTGRRPETYLPMCRAADQSFYGAEIPLPITVKIEPLPENVYFANPGGGPWWHSFYDTLDKVDPPTLLRDGKFHAELVEKIVNSKQLPVHMSDFIDLMNGFLREIETTCDPVEFGIEEVFESLTELKKSVMELESCINLLPDGAGDSIIHKVAGSLIRMTYSSSSCFEYDPVGYAYGRGAAGFIFFKLRRASGVTRKNCPPDKFLCIKTDFLRQKNRIITDIDDLLCYIQSYVDSLRK
jgi:hypothetical protein